MPLISHFYGILIYYLIGGKHDTPRFQAKFAEFEAVFDLDGNIITGELPTNKRKLLEVWCILRREELNAAWTAWVEDNNDVIKIEGLR